MKQQPEIELSAEDMRKLKPWQYDIFISYRRAGAEDFARSIYQDLTNKGYRVFLDRDCLGMGTYKEQILSVLQNVKTVIVLLPKDSLDRCQNPDDLFRQEIACAVRLNKQIIPITREGFVFPNRESLPEDIRNLLDYEAIQDSKNYYDAVIDRLFKLLGPPPKRLVRTGLKALALIAVVVAAIVIAVYAINNRSDQKNALPSNNETGVISIESKNSFKTYLENETAEEVYLFSYGDFDADGNMEMFALMAEPDAPDDGDSKLCELWFVNKSGAVKLKDAVPFRNTYTSYLVDKRTFLMLEEFRTTGSVSCIWSVKNGQPFESYLSGKVYGFDRKETGEFFSTFQSIDFEYGLDEFGNVTSKTGRTWKDYYFFVDDSDLREYGALEITEEQFSRIDGGEEILNKLKTDEDGYVTGWLMLEESESQKLEYRIKNIFYRENGVISINLQIAFALSDNRLVPCPFDNADILHNYYFNYRIKSGKLELEKKEGGLYDKCWLSEIAVFPQEFPY